MWWYCRELMSMQSPMWKKKSSFDRVGGGDIGIIVGIVRDIMTTDGVFIRVLPAGIEGYLMTGEIIIETAGGADIPGIIIPSITVTWIDIGEAVIGETTMDGTVLVDTKARADMIAVLAGAMVALVNTGVPGGAGTGTGTVPGIDTIDK